MTRTRHCKRMCIRGGTAKACAYIGVVGSFWGGIFMAVRRVVLPVSLQVIADLHGSSSPKPTVAVLTRQSTWVKDEAPRGRQNKQSLVVFHGHVCDIVCEMGGSFASLLCLGGEFFKLVWKKQVPEPPT